MRKQLGVAPANATDTATKGYTDVVFSSAVKTVDIGAASTVAIGGFTAAEAQSIFDNALPLSGGVAALRAYTGRAAGIRSTARGITALFQQSTTDTTSADDGIYCIVDGSSRRWFRIIDRALSVKHAGATGDGVTDDTASIQALATLADAKLLAAMFVPNAVNENYLITAPITLTNPGIRVFGEKSATYNRGTGKNGNFVIGGSATHAFDLGNSRTTGNAADNWEVDHVGFIQANGVTANSKDGIWLTSKTNGPDRGASLRNISATGLAKAISIPDPGVSTALATLVIENCCLSNNGYALWAAGNVLGMRFVGNQAEQNLYGAIYGTFNGGVYIADNMLEGQPTPVTITIPSITGSRAKVLIERNYFESLSGAYAMSINSTTDVDVTVRSNYTFQANGGAVDYLQIAGDANVLLDYNEVAPVVFLVSPLIRYGSRFMSKSNAQYAVRSFGNGGVGVKAIIADYQNLIDYGGSHTHVAFTTGTSLRTPYGYRFCTVGVGYNFSTIPMAVAAGDMYTLDILCRIAGPFSSNLDIQVYDVSITNIVNEQGSSGIDVEMNGRWALVSIAFRATIAATALNLRFYNVSGGPPDCAIVGIAAKNYGQIANDGSQKILVTPVVPNLT